MRIAITGAAGYVGGWLTEELVRRGHEVHGQDVAPQAGHSRLTSFWQFDLCGDTLRQEWLWAVKPEVVIHLAALYGRIWGESDLIKTATLNTGLTAAVARDTAKGGGRLMYVSSSEVYGDSANHGTVHPWSHLAPLNMYGLTKKWGEEAAAVYAPDGLAVTRLNMPYGPAFFPPSPGVVPHSSGRPGPVGLNVLHTMVWQAHHGMDLTVHKGTTRCLTWVEDTMRGLATVLESGKPGTWNVSRNDDHILMSELAERVIAATGSKSRIVEIDPPDRVTLRKALGNEALLNLGWKPTVPLDTGISWTHTYYKKFDKDGRWAG